MPELSDDSGSEPDVSILGNRGRQIGTAGRALQHPDIETTQDADVRTEDTSVEDEAGLDVGDHEGGDNEDDIDPFDIHGEDEGLEGEDQHEDEQADFGEPLPDPAGQGLKEISNLGRFTVSSHKQGNGVEELRSDDLSQFWQ